jgi:large subunit ribosomal protein L18
MAGYTKVANPKVRKRLRRKTSIRLRVSGTAERPRLTVFRSTRYVYAQAIDDVTGKVMASVSELEGAIKTATAGKAKKERARIVGKTIGEKLLALKVEAVVFDRNGFIYHGRVKEIADGARESGLKF